MCSLQSAFASHVLMVQPFLFSLYTTSAMTQGLQLHFHKYSHLSFPIQHTVDCLIQSIGLVQSTDLCNCWGIIQHSLQSKHLAAPTVLLRLNRLAMLLLPTHQPRANLFTSTYNCSVPQHQLPLHQSSTALYQATTNMYKFPCFWQKPLMPPLSANQVVRIQFCPRHQR